MTFNEFYSDITSSMEQYNSAGLIDQISVHNWIVEALNELSILPTIRIEYIINVRNNRGNLPEGFKSLYSAVKCEPYVFTTESDEPKDVLLDIYQYKVRELKKTDWNHCDPCELTETESCVVEKVYFHNGVKGNFYYNNLQPLKLKLTPYIKKTKCDRDCLNFSVNNSPNEISINGKTLYTNFKEGNIFIIYNGYEEDEDGFILIPETEENNLEKYLRAYVKRELIFNILENSDSTTNEQFLFQVYSSDMEKYRSRTIGEFKMKKVLGSMKSYKRKIHREFQVYDFGNYSTGHKNRIEFITL